MSNKFVTGEPTFNYLQLKQLDQYMIGHKGYIAGGVFKNIFNNEKIKDVDIFFEKEEDFHHANGMFKLDDDYIPVYKNDKVTAYKNTKTDIVIELIKHTFKKPIDMIKEFDFTVTQFVYYKEEKEDDEIEWKVAFHNKFFEHLHLKRLVIDCEVNEIMLPVNTLNRMFRYAKYGYFPCRETKSKIIQALRNINEYTDELLSNELYNGID